MDQESKLDMISRDSARIFSGEGVSGVSHDTDDTTGTKTQVVTQPFHEKTR